MPTSKASFFTGRRVRPTLQALSALLLFPLLFTACLEEDQQITIADEQAFGQQVIELAPAPAKWVNLKGIKDADITLNKGKESKNRATDAAGPDRGRFNITLKYVVPVTPEQEAVFEQAAARWERIIIKDVPSFTGTLPSAFKDTPPAVDGTLDDVIIEVALQERDGRGGVLGSAGPRFVRTDGFLTLSGVMFFDVADLGFLDSIGLFEEVIVHEMGHVLGVGTLWDVEPFFPRDLRKAEETNPYFIGRQANVFWKAEGGTDFLPIENRFGPGTRLSHWRESVLENELMTGFLNRGENPLSRITAGSMRDLGWGAAMVGEQYDLPEGAMGVDPDGDEDTMDEDNGDAALHIAERETLLYPIGSVTIE